jgi:hypothetical protein
LVQRWSAQDVPKLVSFFTHKYTKESLSWHVLKGEDAAQVLLMKTLSAHALPRRSVFHPVRIVAFQSY